MTIDDILDKASSPEHSRTAGELQDYIADLRMPLLLNAFKEGMSPADRATFDHLPTGDQVKRLQDANYMLKPDLAEKFINYLSVAILKRVSAPLGSQLETAIAKMNNAALSINDRHVAAVEVEHLNAVLLSYGFNPKEMVEKGSKAGFSPHLWQESTQHVGNQYLTKQRNAALALVTPQEAESYLTSVATPATGLDVGRVKVEGPETLKQVAMLFKQYQRGNDLPGFKKQLHQYH